MDEPMIYSLSAARLPAAEQPDLQAILEAWNEATDRLQQTHEALRHEVRRLSDELEAKNRELARKNRLADLGQMASHVAHEVRNSLVPMKLYLSLLRRRITGDAGSLDVLDKVTAGFTALEATVSDLLHFSGQRDPQWNDVRSAHGCSTTFASRSRRSSPRKGLRRGSTVRTATGWRPTATCSAAAVLNLVLNALDAMPGGGELSLTVLPHVGWRRDRSRRQRPGQFRRGSLERLFEPFFTTKSSGTGLGLAIVERIAAGPRRPGHRRQLSRRRRRLHA